MRWRWWGKWGLTLLAVVLALGCGPWRVTVHARDWALFAGGGVAALLVGRPDRYSPDYVDLRSLTWEVKWERVFVPGNPWLFARASHRTMDSLIVGVWGCLAVALLGAVYLWCTDRRRQPGHCRQCGYDISHSPSAHCSECGAVLDGGD